MIANGQQYTDVSGTWTYNNTTSRWEIDASPVFMMGASNDSITANGSIIIIGDSNPSGNNANNQILRLSSGTLGIKLGNSSVNATMNTSAFYINDIPISGGGGGSPGGANTYVQFNDTGL